MSTCPSWAPSVSQDTIRHSDKRERGWRQLGVGGDPGTAGPRREGAGGDPETAGPRREEGQATPRQGWPRGTQRMLLENGGELLQEAPETRGKGQAGVPGLLPRLSSSHGQGALRGSSPCARGPTHALQQIMCLLGNQNSEQAQRGKCLGTQRGRSHIWRQEELCSGTGLGAVMSVPWEGLQVPTKFNPVGWGGGLFQFPKKHVHKNGPRK